MRVFEDIESIERPFQNGVVTIGNFDGVHRGHQTLFEKVMKKAALMDGTSIVMTFEPHPSRIITGKKKPPLITSYERKKNLIREAGLDVMICAPFTREFASLTAEAFARDILAKKIGARAVVVGRDYSFGKNREGDIRLLREYSEKFGFEVDTVDWLPIPGEEGGKISSTKIRALISRGKVADAAGLLGRHYQAEGTVRRGRNRGGRLVGFPTANISLKELLCPSAGVYAVFVDLDGVRFQGAANVGVSPTFDDHIFTVEIHILDFDQDIYGREISVSFVEKIRDEKKFPDIPALSEQIEKDAARAREILSAASDQ
ncbi:Riboflavin kinase / FMN adenylyltransferase [Candidatus Desulfarcum epimagneticum]|uniref:Riboflavin biosynthesis protein n=1 Tax=uncultured Desulfobacteraceae bacterium TaxID=218296 RepID=A0A484HFX0_9BACT|nr:Riboflavin kinase / FMN adenylyltransferase [uncultured Desulfobacteraceae bacterium]